MTNKTGWECDFSFRAYGHAPPCWSCNHYERRVVGSKSEHRCMIARQGFPTIGDHCAAYLYEPGSDIREFNLEA